MQNVKLSKRVTQIIFYKCIGIDPHWVLNLSMNKIRLEHIVITLIDIFWNIIIIIVTPWEFFTRALVDGLSLEFEWQQDSLSLQDSFQCIGRS